MDDSKKIELSLAIPCYNEESSLDAFLKRTRRCLEKTGCAFEFVFVDDGSRDRTVERLLEERQRDPRVKLVVLSRNFGKEAALTCAIRNCEGNAVIPIDVDLQEPPEVIPQMVELWRDGFDMVLAKRASRGQDSFAKRVSSRWFYRVFNRISRTKLPFDVGDYRLMDRKVVDAFCKLPERNRFMKGIFAWLGFKQAEITFDRESRSAGQSKFSPTGLIRFAANNILAFSAQPIRIFSYLGGVVSVASFSYGTFLVARTLLFGKDVPGYASLMVAILFMGGVQLIGLGVLGEYIGHVYNEVKARPLYLVRESFGVSEAV